MGKDFHEAIGSVLGLMQLNAIEENWESNE